MPADGSLSKVIVETRDVKPVSFTMKFNKSMQAGDAPMADGKRSPLDSPTNYLSGGFSGSDSDNGHSCSWTSEGTIAEKTNIFIPAVVVFPGKSITPAGQHFFGADRWDWSSKEFSDMDSVLCLQSYLCNPPHKISVSPSSSMDSFDSTQWGSDSEKEIV